MRNRSPSFMSRSTSSFIGSVRDILEKLVELPRNVKQACLLLLDMAFVTAAMWSLGKALHEPLTVGSIPYCAIRISHRTLFVALGHK